MEPPSAELESNSAAAGGRSGKRLTVAIVVGLLLLTGFVVRQMVYRAYDFSTFDNAPLPRQGLNAPFITSSDSVVETMVELAQLTADDLVYDLGCGDGRIVITAAMRSGCRGVGVDIAPDLVAAATENVKAQGLEDRVTIVEQDVFDVDLSECDAAMMYLLGWMINKMTPQFEQMDPGSVVLTHDFWLDYVDPEKVVEVWDAEKKESHIIYMYTIPLKKNPALEKGRPPLVTHPLLDKPPRSQSPPVETPPSDTPAALPAEESSSL